MENDHHNANSMEYVTLNFYVQSEGELKVFKVKVKL